MTAAVASSAHATDRRARKSSLIADPLAPALASQALAHRSLAPHSPAATRVQVVRAVRLESLQGDRTGWFVGWCRVVSLGSEQRWTQKGAQPIDRSSHFHASISTVTDSAKIGVLLLSSLFSQRAPCHRHLWRARDAARAARDLSGERARGARAALTADPLAVQRCGERAAGCDRVVGAADEPAPGEADATCAYGVVPSRSSGARAVEAATFLSLFARRSPVVCPSFSRPSLVVVPFFSRYIPCYSPVILPLFSQPSPALLPSSFSYFPAG